MTKNDQTFVSRFQAPIILGFVSIIFSLPLLLGWSWIGKGDWELFVTVADSARISIVEYGQFPFWNPYLGGGNILFTHPEVGILSPSFIHILVFGAVAGLKIKMLLAYFIGLWGTYLFARKLGISKISSYLTAIVFFGSSYFALHFAIGHVPFTHFCFLPWFVYFLLKAEDNWKYIFGSSIAIALIILGNGAAVPFLYTCFFSGLFIALYAFEYKNYKLIKKYIVSIVLGLMLSAVKFVPMYYYLSQNQWEGMATDATPISFLFKAFFSFEQGLFDTVRTAEHWGWHEYSSYIFPLVVLLAVIALVYSFKKNRLYLILGLFFLIFGLGHFSDYSPWAIISGLPGFSSIRSPARAFQFVILATAILSGFGLDIIMEKMKLSGKLTRQFPIFVIVLVTAVSLFVNYPALSTIKHKLPDKKYFNSDFQHVVGSKFDIYKNLRQNRGSLVTPWLSAYKESRGIVLPDNSVLMEYFFEGEGAVTSRTYTPNEVTYSWNANTPGIVSFGIGYDEGWYDTGGYKLFDNEGLLSTRFNAGYNSITMKYIPPKFYIGLILTLLAVALILLIYIYPNFAKWLKPIFD